MFPTLPQSLGDRLVPNSDDDKLSFPNIHNSHSDQNCHIYNSAQSNKGIHIAHQKLIKDSGRSTKQQHLPAMRLENPAMPHRRTCAHRRRTTGIAYISIIFCYGLFLPRDAMSWSSRPPRHVVPPPTSPQPTLPPVFDPRPHTNITVTASKTAVMSCVVHNLANNSVSWIRHRDLHILSVGLLIYTNDDRFRVVPNKTTGDWALRLKYAQPKDSGQYDCQVSSTPTVARTFHLEIVEPQAEVLRAPEMHVGVGSLINLTCVVPYSPETPEYLHWYHKERMVREDGHRVWVRTQLGVKSISQLVVRDARPSDSGLYTCHPSHSREHSITVHVLTAGEYPAAMQGGSSLTCAPHWRLLRLMVAPVVTLLIASHKPYFYM